MARLRWLAPLLLLLAWAGLSATPRAPRAAVLAEDAQPWAGGGSAIISAEPPASLDALREAIAEVLRHEGVAGVGLALVDREGIVWAGGVGVADRDRGVPVTGDTVFRVASITKSIVGLGVARLVAQGRLSLDTPLSQLLPELAIDNPWADDSPVTLAHALEHTAGFDDMRFNEWFTTDEAITPAEALAINPRSRRVRWRPGSRMAYSNVGYSIAALAIERATGEPFDAWLRAEVLGPLGMPEATFGRTASRSARLATGYLAPDRAAPFSPLAHRPAGALLASPLELGQLVHFWLRRGEGRPGLVPPAALARIEHTGTLELFAPDVGYGLGNYGDVSHPARSRGHDGGLPGFWSCYRYFPELGVGYVVLLNGTYSPRAYVEVRRLVFDYLTRGMRLPSPPRVSPDPEREHAAGYYALANPRNELFGFVARAVLGLGVAASPEGLELTLPAGARVEVVATADGYRHPRESGTSIRLGRDRDGERVLAAGWVQARPASRGLATARLVVLVVTMLLLQLAPILAAGWLLLRLVRRRGFDGAGVWLWPALAGLSSMVIPVLLSEASARDALGRVDITTVGLCAATVLFALASTFGLSAAVRATLARTRTPWWARALPSLTSTLAVGLTLWLGAHGIIGLRTWAW